MKKINEFNNEQIKEIKEGFENGLSYEQIGMYAKPEFCCEQMATIRIGLEEGLDVSIYAKPEFDWTQMEEIRLGLGKGLNASIYAIPEFDWREMEKIRERLERQQ